MKNILLSSAKAFICMLIGFFCLGLILNIVTPNEYHTITPWYSDIALIAGYNIAYYLFFTKKQLNKLWQHTLEKTSPEKLLKEYFKQFIVPETIIAFAVPVILFLSILFIQLLTNTNLNNNMLRDPTQSQNDLVVLTIIQVFQWALAIAVSFIAINTGSSLLHFKMLLKGDVKAPRMG